MCSVVSVFPHQIGGHKRKPFMSLNGCMLLKPMVKIENFHREVEFYIKTKTTIETSKFFVSFHGTIWLNENVGDLTEKNPMTFFLEETVNATPHLKLEDITSPFCKPCVADIKIGKQTYEPSAPLSKIEYECSKYPFQTSLGFRITGYKVFDSELQSYLAFDKYYCRKLVPEEGVLTALGLYFYNKYHSFKLKELSGMVAKIESLLEWMERQNDFNFYSSSLLLVYEGSLGNSAYDVRLIDFGHVVNVSAFVEKDDNCSYGLHSLLIYFKKILSTIQKTSSYLSHHNEVIEDDFSRKVKEMYGLMLNQGS